jgi:hypothetical protein
MGMGQDHVLDPVLLDWNSVTRSLLCFGLVVLITSEWGHGPEEGVLVLVLVWLPVMLWLQGEEDMVGRRMGKMMMVVVVL